MIGKIVLGTSLLVLGFMMGFVYGTEIGHTIWEVLFDWLKGRFT